MYLLKLQDPSDDPFDDPFLDVFFSASSPFFMFGVLPGMYCWVILEANHELKSVTPGYLSDDELPHNSFIATMQLKAFGSGAGCPTDHLFQ